MLFPPLSLVPDCPLSPLRDTWCSLSSNTIFFFFLFLKTCRTFERVFFLHSLSLNSFRTCLSPQSLLCTRIQNLHVVHFVINDGSLFMHSHKNNGLNNMQKFYNFCNFATFACCSVQHECMVLFYCSSAKLQIALWSSNLSIHAVAVNSKQE